uniref:Uncharacterized protein n=1 Tax=Auxenochlorella protothecoides TaxID=3075 RepID=A0A1D2AGU1_AUXPR
MAVSSIRLFDAHCHLQDARFGAGELDDILSRSRAAGVSRMAVNGCCVEDWPLVHAIAAAHGEMVVANYGLHPWWVGRQPDHWLDLLRQRLLANPGAGLGECGLDRSRRAPPCPFEEQVSVFKAQLLLAQELQRPLSVRSLSVGDVEASIHGNLCEYPNQGRASSHNVCPSTAMCACGAQCLQRHLQVSVRTSSSMPSSSMVVGILVAPLLPPTTGPLRQSGRPPARGAGRGAPDGACAAAFLVRRSRGRACHRLRTPLRLLLRIGRYISTAPRQGHPHAARHPRRPPAAGDRCPRRRAAPGPRVARGAARICTLRAPLPGAPGARGAEADAGPRGCRAGRGRGGPRSADLAERVRRLCRASRRPLGDYGDCIAPRSQPPISCLASGAPAPPGLP